MTVSQLRLACALTAAGALTALAAGDVVAGDVIVKSGDVFGSRTVSTLNGPFTNGNGQVGFVAAFDDATRGVWFDTGFIFNSSDALPDSLTGGEGTMGIGNAGQFIYSPAFNGNDAVYGQDGLIAQESDPAPGLPGFNSTFHSRPQMTDDGTAY